MIVVLAGDIGTRADGRHVQSAHEDINGSPYGPPVSDEAGGRR